MQGPCHGATQQKDPSATIPPVVGAASRAEGPEQNYFRSGRFSPSAHIIILSLTRDPPPCFHALMSVEVEIDDDIPQTRDTATRVIVKGELYELIIACRGNKMEIARRLGVSRARVSLTIDSAPALLSKYREVREGLLDKAEDNIFADVERGDAGASRFVLSTIGKERGYTQGVVGAGKNGAIEIEVRQFGPAQGNADGNVAQGKADEQQ